MGNSLLRITAVPWRRSRSDPFRGRQSPYEPNTNEQTQRPRMTIREELDSLLDPIRGQIVEVASQAQESVNAAVQHGMEHCQEVIQQKENSDWSEWSLLDMEEFQELQQRVGPQISEGREGQKARRDELVEITNAQTGPLVSRG